MSLVNAFGNLALDSSVAGISTQLSENITVIPSNIKSKFRDSFESFTPGQYWNITTADGDIVQLDGNCGSASYLVISRDPLTTGGVTTLTSVNSFQMPLETSIGLSISQRVVGQEFSMEVISDETPLPTINDVQIAAISQSSTTLTVTTSVPHNLVPGKRIGIYGVSDSRFNYPSLVVASIVNDTQFTVTAGPGGTIPSLTVTGPNNSGFVYARLPLGSAVNGLSQIFENGTATNSSVYLRASAGDALPSGTANGSHTVTTATTSSTQLINSSYAYSFLPSSEFKWVLQADRVQVFDSSIDSTSAPTNRVFRTQVVPDFNQDYKLRFRLTNNKGLTVPTAKIISAVKTGSTTATITTDIPHGLTTTDYIVVYGINNQTSFANLTTATAVASTPTPTTFTISFGASATATSYGGMVARVQGGNIPGAYTTTVIQSAANDGNELTLVGNANWGHSVGDYVNVYGCRDTSSGADLGVDGAYKVVYVSTTTTRLIPIGSTTLPSTFTTTNAGGTVIKRSDLRLGFARVFDYTRERVETLSTGASAAAVPVSGTISVSGSTVTPNSLNTYSLLTSTTLGSGATYTGSSINSAATSTSPTIYPVALSVSVQHTAGLAHGTLVYEVGSETSSTSPTTWYPQFTVPIPSNTSWSNFILPLTTRYYRLRFINGATAQTSFRLATVTYFNGPLSNDLTYPDFIRYPLSTTALGSNATFTGAAYDFGEVNNVYKSITAVAYADQSSSTNGFKIEISRDASTWVTATSATVSANTLSTITTNLVYRYARVVYTNSASAQTSFSLDATANN